MRYPVLNFLGQSPPPPPLVPIPTQAQRQGLTCPAVPKDDPTLVCVQTRDGGVICSNNAYFPPGCPTPPYEEGEYATYTANQGFLYPTPPKARSLTVEVGSAFPVAALAIAAAGYVISIVMDL